MYADATRNCRDTRSRLHCLSHRSLLEVIGPTPPKLPRRALETFRNGLDHMKVSSSRDRRRHRSSQLVDSHYAIAEPALLTPDGVSLPLTLHFGSSSLYEWRRHHWVTSLQRVCGRLSRQAPAALRNLGDVDKRAATETCLLEEMTATHADQNETMNRIERIGCTLWFITLRWLRPELKRVCATGEAQSLAFAACSSFSMCSRQSVSTSL